MKLRIIYLLICLFGCLNANPYLTKPVPIHKASLDTSNDSNNVVFGITLGESTFKDIKQHSSFKDCSFLKETSDDWLEEYSLKNCIANIDKISNVSFNNIKLAFYEGKIVEIDLSSDFTYYYPNKPFALFSKFLSSRYKVIFADKFSMILNANNLDIKMLNSDTFSIHYSLIKHITFLGINTDRTLFGLTLGESSITDAKQNSIFKDCVFQYDEVAYTLKHCMLHSSEVDNVVFNDIRLVYNNENKIIGMKFYANTHSSPGIPSLPKDILTSFSKMLSTKYKLSSSNKHSFSYLGKDLKISLHSDGINFNIEYALASGS